MPCCTLFKPEGCAARRQTGTVIGRSHTDHLIKGAPLIFEEGGAQGPSNPLASGCGFCVALASLIESGS